MRLLAALLGGMRTSYKREDCNGRELAELPGSSTEAGT
jgi:hypothetical protein